MDTYLPYNTGGPEALVQLAIALHSVYNNTFIWRKAIHQAFYVEYSEVIPIPVLNDLTDEWAPGDIFIVPDIRHACGNKGWHFPGVATYTYLLGSQQSPSAHSRHGCNFLAHDFFLGSGGGIHGVNLSRSLVIRPYVRPSIAEHCNQARHQAKAGNYTVLVDNDTPPDISAKTIQVCNQTVNGGGTLCKVAIVPAGWSSRRWPESDMNHLRATAHIILDWHLVGSERLPLESVLCGAVMITSSAGASRDRRDFPLPARNVLNNSSQLAEAIPRILANFDEEQRDMEPMATLYRGLGARSMAVEARAALRTILRGQSVEDR